MIALDNAEVLWNEEELIYFQIFKKMFLVKMSIKFDEYKSAILRDLKKYCSVFFMMIQNMFEKIIFTLIKKVI